MNCIFLTPVFNVSDIIEDWAYYIRKLNPKPSKIIFLENNSNDNTLKMLYDLDVGTEKEIIKIHTINPKELPFKKAYDIIAHVRQLLLTRCRQLNPECAIFIDSDIFIKTPDIITGLSMWGEDIVGGAFIRHFPEGPHVASLWKTDNSEKPYRLYSPEGFRKLNKALHEVHLTSTGCLYLSRKIIQDRRVNFFPLKKGYSEDFGYCYEARQAGYKIYLDSLTILTHRIRGKWKAWNKKRRKSITRKEYDKKD